MGRTKTSDSSSSSENSKKKDKQPKSSKSYQNDSDSDSEVQPQVYPGTHWPLDSTLELLINYDAVKEIRAVKPDFYPMLFYLTKSDYSSVARVLCKLPVIMDHLQARLDKMKGISQSSAPVEVKPTQPPKTVTLTVIRDLKSAKEEILKLLSNMCLNQNDAAELLDWFNSFGTKKRGRTGFHLYEQEKIEEHSKPVTRTQSKVEEKLVSESRSIVTRAQEKHDNRPVNVKKQVKNDNKSVGTANIRCLRKDASPVDNKSRPPTREEIYANINKMTAAQILSQTDNVKKKQTDHCPENKSPNDKIRTKRRGRPRKLQDSDDETDSTFESASKKTKTKSHASKSVSPSVSFQSLSPPLLSPQPTTSPSRFSLSMGARQTASDAIKCVLNNKLQQSSGVGNKDINTGEKWSQHTPGSITLQGPHITDPLAIQTSPFRNNFGPVPMCLYKVQGDTDETPMNDSLELVTPKIEIDNAEEDESCEQCFVKVEPGPSVECSVTASGIKHKSIPIIKTICTGPVCGGDNCKHEHSVIVEDCDNPDTDCVQETFNHDAKEAEPVIIIDDC